MQIETLRTDGFLMNYCRFGQGREPLVILPGISVQRVMDSAQAISAAYSPLAKDFTVYVFERREDLTEGTSVTDMARDAAAAISALELGPVNLFGTSQGGMMAMAIAIERPELVRRLALGSTTARVTEARYQGLFEPWAALAKSGDAEALYLSFAEALYPQRIYMGARAMLIDLAKGVTDGDLRRFVIQTEALRGFDMVVRLDRIACPTLVIGDTDDRVVGGEASEAIAKRLRNGKLYMYDGYGHAAYDLAPDYKQRLLRFLTL